MKAGANRPTLKALPCPRSNPYENVEIFTKKKAGEEDPSKPVDAEKLRARRNVGGERGVGSRRCDRGRDGNPIRECVRSFDAKLLTG